MRQYLWLALVSVCGCGETPSTGPRPDATTRDTSTEASVAPLDTAVSDANSALDVSVDVARDVRLETSADSSTRDTATAADTAISQDTAVAQDTAISQDTAVDTTPFASRCFGRVNANCPQPICPPGRVAEILNACYTGNCIDPTVSCSCTQNVHCGAVEIICRGTSCVPCGNPEPCSG